MARDAAPSASPIAAADWPEYSPAPDRTGRVAQIAARKSRWRRSPAPECPDAVEPGIFARHPHRERIDVARQHRFVQRLRRGDREHAGAGAEIEHAPRPVAPSAHDRAAAGSRAWCRDGRCRTPAPPRSRCRACWAATWSRSCWPCTTKRPAGTGTRSSRLALTQSLASTVSKTMACATSSPAALATSSRISVWSGGSAKCTVTSQRPSGRSNAAIAAWPSKKLSVSTSTTRLAVCSSPIAKLARCVDGVDVIGKPGEKVETVWRAGVVFCSNLTEICAFISRQL